MKKLLTLTLALLALPWALQAATLNFGWDANTESDLAGYRLFQSTRSLIGMTTVQALGDATITKTAVGVTTFTSLSVTENATYYFSLTAFNTSGMESSFSNEVSTFVKDSTLPTISMTAPTNGSTVSGSNVTVSATASDNVGVVGVQFKLDGVNLSAEDMASPYSTIWNSTTTTNGSHVLSATARDAAGNIALSSVTITVNNVAADTTPPTISAVAVGSITCYVATISWTTNELASSTVTFSTSSSMSPSTQVSAAGLVTSHLISLSGLTANTTYYFRVASADAAGNGSISNSTFNTHKIGDINGDASVNIFDLSAMMSHWNATGNSYPAGDFYPLGNPDGNVNIFDLSSMMSYWGQ